MESPLGGYLVGGFNPFEKYKSNWIISPSRDENKEYLKPPPSLGGYDICWVESYTSGQNHDNKIPKGGFP